MAMTTPAHAELVHLVTLFNQGQLDEAERLGRAMARQHPDFGLGWKVLGSVLRHRGQADEALPCMDKAAQLLPGDPEVHGNRGNVLRDLGRFEEARDSHLRALQLKPDFSPGWNNLGNVQRDLRRLDDAQASYRQALALDPGHAQALSNLGLTLKDQQRLVEAREVLLLATRQHPGAADAWCHLGVTLNEMGQFQQAQAALAQSIQLAPANAHAYAQLAVSLRQLGQLAQARACLEQALVLAPDLADAHNSLGAVLNDLGLAEDALASFRRALAVNARHVGALTNLATSLTNRGQFDAGLQVFEQALQARPDFREAHDNLLFALNYHPDLPAQQIFQAYRRFDELLGQPLKRTWPAPAAERARADRLRVGYVSPDLRRHSCRHFLQPLLAHHDKRAFEVFAYAELAREDDTTRQLRGHVDHWRATWGMSDEALARQIADDGIDILVDLAGHTAGNRLAVFARKPAPVAVSWLGYGYTTGLSAIDHFLTDWPTAPAGAEPLFSESLWRLDRAALAFRPDESMLTVGSLPAAQRGHVSFGTFTRAIRINQHTVRAWSAILQRLPGARLVIDSQDFQSPSLRQDLAARFAEHGITADRLAMGYHSPPWQLMQQVDICLDCFPHNSGTTLFEALYMGLPVVTLASRPSVGRLGSAILQALGHPEWVALDEADYVRIACDLAQDLSALAAMRAGLRSAMAASPLMDEAGFARAVENAFRAMWRRRPA